MPDTRRKVFRLIISTAVLTVLGTHVSRFVDPVGESYMIYLAPGAVDFYFPFNGARALLRGVNPYVHDEKDLFDPWHRDDEIARYGEDCRAGYRQYYPPTHLLLYVPFVWLSGGDPKLGGRILFGANLLALAGLAWLTVRLLGKGRGSAELWLLMLVVLAACEFNAYGLERGQSDILGALMLWGGVVLAMEGRFGRGLFLLSTVCLVKPYALPVVLGVGLWALRRHTPWRRTLLGAVLPLILFLAPVARYLPDALKALKCRANLFGDSWYNHGIANLVFYLTDDLKLAQSWRLPTLLVSLVPVGIALRRALRTRRAGSTEDEHSAWIACFVASLAAVLLYPAWSSVYNLVYIVPGALVMALRWKPIGPPRGIALLASAYALMMVALLMGHGTEIAFPVATLGLIMALLLSLVAIPRDSGATEMRNDLGEVPAKTTAA